MEINSTILAFTVWRPLLLSCFRPASFAAAGLFLGLTMLDLPAARAQAADATAETRIESAISTADQALSADKKSDEYLVGEIMAIRKAVLTTNVSGRLVKMPYFTGDYIKASTALASLETRDFEIAVRQAQAAVDASTAKLRQMEAGCRPEEKKQAEEQLRQAQANTKNANAEYLRMKELFAARVISRQAMEAVEVKATVSDAQYSQVKQQKSLVDQGPRAEEKESMRAVIRQQEAGLELAKMHLEYATLKAPFDGIVAVRHADEGSFISPAAPIYTLIQIDPVYAAVECPERLLPLLHRGLRAVVTVDALPGKKFSGALERIPAVIDPVTRSAKAEFVIENPQLCLRPGMFARAVISLEARSGE